MSRRQGWQIAHYALFAATIGTGALNMLRVRGGFLTNHLADVAVPAWLYIASRGLHSRSLRRTFIQRTIGRTPPAAALILFVASTCTEVSQYFWPHGLFPGRFDPLDVAAYGVGLAACLLAERRWPPAPEHRHIEERDAAA